MTMLVWAYLQQMSLSCIRNLLCYRITLIKKKIVHGFTLQNSLLICTVKDGKCKLIDMQHFKEK